MPPARLEPSLVGRRVTVRSRVPGETAPSGRPAMTDVVGRVRAVDDAGADVERRDGALVRVVAADVVSVTVVPDRPRRTRSPFAISADDLTRVATRGWPPAETAPLGDWLLRAAAGFTGRANSVAVHGDPGVPFDDALAAVVGFYAARELPARAQVVVGSDWERRLVDAGWGPLPGVRGGAVVQVATLEEAGAAATGTSGGDVVLSVDDVLDDAWLSLYPRTDGPDPAAVRTVLAGPPATGFVRATEAGRLVAIGRVAVTGEWAGLAAVEVLPDHRRRGLGTAVVGAALTWAAGQGADKAYLQTMRDNPGALALYAGLGFTDHHDYRYVSPAAQ